MKARKLFTRTSRSTAPMLRKSTAPCVLCQMRCILRPQRESLTPWISIRGMAQLQKRQPSRMILSNKVASRERENSHTESGAFGSMNRTTVPEGLANRKIRRPAAAISAARSRQAVVEKEPSTGLKAVFQERTRPKGPGAFGAMNRTTVSESFRARTQQRPAADGPPRLSLSPKIRKTVESKPKRKEGEYHALKMHKALDTMSYHSRMKIKDEIAAVESFDQFNLLPLVKNAIGVRALGGKEEITPTPIQKVAIPALMGMSPRRPGASVKSFLLAAETGSGKTLAYLLPILDHIKRTEELEKIEESKVQEEMERKAREDPTFIEPPPLDDRIHSTSGRPRAIILLPTAELVSQVTALLRQLSFDVKFRSKGISAANSPTVIKRNIFAEQGIDILVATPHLLESIAFSDPNILSRVRHLVIDEADSLLDRSFSKAVDPIIERATPSLEKIIFCSATIPQSIDRYLARKYPNMTRLVTPNLHAIPRRVQLSVIDIEKEPYRGNRDIACADIIHGIGKSAHEPSPDEPPEFATKRIIVFVNEREETTRVAEYLRSKGIDAVALNRDTEAERRSDLLKAFTIRPPHMRGPNDQNPPEHLSSLEPVDVTTRLGRSILPNTKVLVTTDIASRGIDTLAVRNVVLYDVPHSTIDFIHRLGRTGRMKMRGRGVVLVGKNDRRDVVKEVKDGMFRGQALI